MLEDPKVSSALEFMPTEGFTSSERETLTGNADQPERDSLSGNERNHLFLGIKGTHFQDVSGLSGVDHLGDSRAFAILDYDRDGWQDLAVVNANAPLFLLYRNQLGLYGNGHSAKGNIIAIRFVGSNHTASAIPSRSNRDGIGAKVRISLAGAKLVREHRAGEGMAAQNSSTMLIGIGERKQAEDVTVTWPAQMIQKVGDVPAGTLVTVYEDAEQAPGENGFVLESYHVRSQSAVVTRTSRSTTADRQLRFENTSGSKAALRLYTAMATWCLNCRNEIPQVSRLRTVFGRDDLEIFGVPLDEKETQQDFAAYVKRHKPAYKLLRELNAKQLANVKAILQEELKSDGFPATIVTNQLGDVLAVVPGVPSISLLRKLLDEAAK